MAHNTDKPAPSDRPDRLTYKHFVDISLDEKVRKKIKLFNDLRRDDDFESPWGYAYPITRVGSSTLLHEHPRWIAEEDPTFYDSVRDMFRVWRLGICDCSIGSDPLETIRLALHSIHLKRHVIDLPAMIDDVYAGSIGYYDLHIQFLENHALVGKCDAGDRTPIELSREGRAALIMLLETAPGSNIDTSPRAILKRQQEADVFIKPLVTI